LKNVIFWNNEEMVVMRKRIDLCGDYLLLCEENCKVKQWEKLPVTLDALQYTGANSQLLTGKVPGNFELDLFREGFIEDPFFDTNVWDMQKLENRHVFYGRSFTYTAIDGMEPVLVFEGIDTLAEVYINGEQIAYCDNMFITYRIPIPQVKEGRNELVVHILPVCIEARKSSSSAYERAAKYNFETLRIRKATSMFGWDIMPRLVSAGIWRPVYIEYRPLEYLEQTYLMTIDMDVEKETARMILYYDTFITDDDISQYSIRIEMSKDSQTFVKEERLWFKSGYLWWNLENVSFWWPRGYGEPALYDVKVTLWKKETASCVEAHDRTGDSAEKEQRILLDSKTFRTGIRTVKLERTSVTDAEHNGQFRFLVNGKEIFILGTNFVPIDAYHSRDRERLPKVVDLLWESGCNAIRIWGGGVYEDDYLYDKCDELGILIWQDFMMACAVHPNDAEFCEVMHKEATRVIRRLRQHPSILVWAGDNECDSTDIGGAFQHKPNRNRITRIVLQDAADFEDPVRPYLPSSPYIDPVAEQYPTQRYLSENHLWGARDYFKTSYYKDAPCNFASEIGYHGCVSKASMERFLTKEHMWPWQDNAAWIAHASCPEKEGKYTYRIGLMAKQIKELFGFIPDNLDDFILASQISQAEAKKFFIENFRLGRPHRTGIIWWNLIDGWPQFSDAVVDYYFDKKLAFDYICTSQKPLLITFREPAGWQLRLTASNDTGKEQQVHVKLWDYLDGNRLLWEKDCCLKEGYTELTAVPYSFGEKKLYVIEWCSGRETVINHFLAGNPPYELEEYRRFLKEIYCK